MGANAGSGSGGGAADGDGGGLGNQPLPDRQHLSPIVLWIDCAYDADEAVDIGTCVLLATSTTRSHAGSGGILRYLGGSHLLLQSCRSSKLKPFAEQLNVKALYQRLYTPALVS